MKFTYFIQNGNRKQTEPNGMGGCEYWFAARKGISNSGFRIKNHPGGWSIDKKYAMTFKIFLVF